MDTISLLHCFLVGSVRGWHWTSLHTINICFLHEEPMPVTVLYFLSLCCEQRPHRQLFIDSSAGCSCVWILLVPYPHDHHFLLILVTALTHITRIHRNFDVANSPRYHAGFTPMLFQWSYSHMAHFSSQICCNFFTVQFFHSRPLFIVRFLFCRAIFHVQTGWALLFVLQLIALLFVFPIDNTYE